MAVKDDLAFQFIPVLLDVIVLHHNYHHINFTQELIEIQYLVLNNLFISKEWIEGFKWTSKMTFLDVEHLKSWTFADIIDILFIGDAIETYAAVVGDAVFLHNLIDTFQYENGLTVIGLHGFINDFCQLRIVAYEEPRVNGDAVAA